MVAAFRIFLNNLHFSLLHYELEQTTEMTVAWHAILLQMHRKIIITFNRL